MADVAIVTGASRGIGKAIADALALCGFDVARLGLEPETGTIDSAGAGVRSRHYCCDVADIALFEAVLERIATDLGEPTCLVNNAGVTSLQRGDILDVSPESYDRTMGINLRGGFFLTQAFARRFIRQGPSGQGQAGRRGSVIFIGSVNAEIVGENRADYCISKAGVGMMSKLFAARLARIGLAVFEVRPGVIRTDMTRPAAARYDALIADGLVPMGRWGEPEDVGATVAALASGALPYATGIHVDVGGGLQLHRL